MTKTEWNKIADNTFETAIKSWQKFGKYIMKKVIDNGNTDTNPTAETQT